MAAAGMDFSKSYNQCFIHCGLTKCSFDPALAVKREKTLTAFVDLDEAA